MRIHRFFQKIKNCQEYPRSSRRGPRARRRSARKDSHRIEQSRTWCSYDLNLSISMTGRSTEHLKKKSRYEVNEKLLLAGLSLLVSFLFRRHRRRAVPGRPEHTRESECSSSASEHAGPGNPSGWGGGGGAEGSAPCPFSLVPRCRVSAGPHTRITNCLGVAGGSLPTKETDSHERTQSSGLEPSQCEAEASTSRMAGGLLLLRRDEDVMLSSPRD